MCIHMYTLCVFFFGYNSSYRNKSLRLWIIWQLNIYTIYLDNLDGTAQRRGGCFPALPGWSTLGPPCPH